MRVALEQGTAGQPKRVGRAGRCLTERGNWGGGDQIGKTSPIEEGGTNIVEAFLEPFIKALSSKMKGMGADIGRTQPKERAYIVKLGGRNDQLTDEFGEHKML